MSKYVGKLLELIGEESENPRDEVTTEAGLPDVTLLDYINRAIQRLQTVIMRDVPHCTQFDTRSTFPSVADQNEYDMPGDAFYKGYVRGLQYKRTSSDTYIPLAYTLNDNQFSEETTDEPSHFSLRGGKIVVSPTPSVSTGTFRLTYVRSIDDLDKRRGVVESVASSGGYYTSITLDVDDVYYDSDAIEGEEYVNVVTTLGGVNYYNLRYSSFDSATGVITLPAATYATTIGTISAGDYVTSGEYTTTHSSLPRQCDRYIVRFASWKALNSDSSDDSVPAGGELEAMEAEIVSAFSTLYLGVFDLPIFEPEWTEE
jgi:hypothetical protein